MNVPSVNSHGDPELDALLGAYALDALDPNERARVEEYIANNSGARDEVDELRESAASLALAPARNMTAPPELWERISRQIGDEPRVFTPLSTRRAGPRATVVLAAAAAIALVFLAASVLVVRDRDSRPTDLAKAFDNAANASNAHEAALTSAQGATVARIVVLPDGTGYLRNDSMRPLPEGRTYQLWALTGDTTKPTAISAGVLGASPGTVAFHTTGTVHGFGITIEQSPGVVSSTQQMYASVSLS